MIVLSKPMSFEIRGSNGVNEVTADRSARAKNMMATRTSSRPANRVSPFGRVNGFHTGLLLAGECLSKPNHVVRLRVSYVSLVVVLMVFDEGSFPVGRW